ncbi:MAG: hypothetical protein KBG64_01800 [Clostridia bacterium]|nr:hypothetical protein [Clostridia bacterium]
MFSELNKFSNMMIAFAVISGLDAIFNMVLFYQMLEYSDYRRYFIFVAMIILCIPLLFSVLSVALKRIVSEMESESKVIMRRMSEIEKRMK